MLRVGVFAVVIVGLVLLMDNAKAGRTIKKHSAIVRKPVDSTENTEQELEYQAPEIKKGKSSVHSKKPVESDLEDSEECNDEDGHCKKKTVEEDTSTAVATLPHAQHQPSYSYFYPQRLPPTMYQLHWRHRLQQQQQVSAANSTKRTQRLLGQIQRDAMDMARGFLSGFGWELQGWELILLESIVRTVSKDLLFMFQFLF